MGFYLRPIYNLIEKGHFWWSHTPFYQLLICHAPINRTYQIEHTSSPQTPKSIHSKSTKTRKISNIKLEVGVKEDIKLDSQYYSGFLKNEKMILNLEDDAECLWTVDMIYLR